MADEVDSAIRAALLTLVVEQTVGLVVRHFVVKPQPFPDSLQISEESAERLQPRSGSSPVHVGWSGPGPAPDWLKKLNQ